MVSSKTFLEAVKERRTYYALNKDIPISEKEVQDIVKEVVLHVPSSFNSQSARLVLLLNDEHDRFWDFTLEVLKTMVPADQLPPTEQKIAGFKAAKGSVSTSPFPMRSNEHSWVRLSPHTPSPHGRSPKF
jgi:predicted oxidoreductase (fatty acid repression mutant protein)